MAPLAHEAAWLDLGFIGALLADVLRSLVALQVVVAATRAQPGESRLVRQAEPQGSELIRPEALRLLPEGEPASGRAESLLLLVGRESGESQAPRAEHRILEGSRIPAGRQVPVGASLLVEPRLPEAQKGVTPLPLLTFQSATVATLPEEARRRPSL